MPFLKLGDLGFRPCVETARPGLWKLNAVRRIVGAEILSDNKFHETAQRLESVTSSKRLLFSKRADDEFTR